MKKILLVLILAITAFFAGRNFELIKTQAEKLAKRINLKPNFVLVLVVAISCLVLGILIGKGTKAFQGIAKKMPQAVSKAFTIKPTNELVIGNFESEGDFKKWETRSAKFKQSTEYVTEGQFSGEMKFSRTDNFSNIKIEDYFDRTSDISNWSGYNQLRFEIYNPNSNSVKLILKIRGKNKKNWQRKMWLAPNDNTEVKIYISDLEDAIDISWIRQFNFFVYKTTKDLEFYIDNIRLIPEKAEQKSLNSLKPSSDKKKGFLFNEENEDFGIAVDSAIRKVFLEPGKFEGFATDTIEMSLARNEYESSQIVIHAKKSLEDIQLEISDLVANNDGKELRIDKENIQSFVVGYVKTKKADYPVSHVGMWPDPLEEKKVFNVKANALQSIWIQVYAPEDVPAGKYTGTIILKSANSESKTVKIRVNVWDFSLPKQTSLRTAFGFYDYRLWRMYPTKEGESEQDYNVRLSQLKKQYYLDMIRHRIMPIGNFDLDVDDDLNNLKLYLDNGLSVFAFGKYSGSHGNNWPKDPQELNQLIGVYRDHANYLKENNLIEKAYLYSYDEPAYGDPFVDEVTKMVHKADPQLKNMVCMGSLSNPDKFPGWGDDIDIWCIRNVSYNEKLANQYREQGKEIWIYVSGPNPPFPTLVIDYPSMAYRIVPWMCWKYDIKGYLYWCLNFWEDNPWENPVNKWGQNGNGFLYYPGEDGPVGSIRLKVTRDGIEDYEYLHLLDKKIREANSKNLAPEHKDLLEKAQNLLQIDDFIVESMADYTKDPHVINRRREDIALMIEALDSLIRGNTTQVIEDFSGPIIAEDSKTFGKHKQLTFELYRGGTFDINGESGYARQKSDNYGDVAIIRSTKALPKTYKISAVVGEIDYGLEKLEGLENDPNYSEGPLDQNGAYLLAITDTEPSGHHTNDWWHEHRKLVIDVDNNIWGKGMPNPIFMVYFDKDNELNSLDGENNQWLNKKWRSAVHYQEDAWYRVEIEKTETNYIMNVYDSEDNLLKGGVVGFDHIWNADDEHPDYLVIGEPHENYYQGSMKIKEITMSVEVE